MTSVAVLGTGTMGAGMARNIAAAGLETRVWNRNPQRAAPLADAGATVCTTVAEAVTGADVVLTMLWDTQSVIETLRLGEGAFGTGTVLVQTSTVGVDGAAAIGHLAKELGLTYLDAPVLGTKQPAEAGTLVILASGAPEAESVVAPVFAAIGSKTIWTGSAGSASRLKLVANAFVLSLNASIAQSIGMARALDLDPGLFLEAVRGGAMDSLYVQGKGAGMVAGEFPAAFGLDGGVKDAALVLEAVTGTGADLTVIQAVHDQLKTVLEAGYGEEDISAVSRVHSSR